MNIEQKLACYMRQGDYEGYIAARYPFIGDGESIVFRGEDFSNVDLRKFPLAFSVFEQCNLNNAKIAGFPVTIKRSSAKRLSLDGVSAVIDAYNSDFRGLRYNEHTILARQKNGEGGCSHFYGCRFDVAAQRYFAKQGVRFDR